MKTIFAFLCAFIATVASAAAAAPSSVSKIAFGPPNVLFAADWKAGRIYAFALPAASPRSARPFNLTNLEAPIARAVGTTKFTLQDLAMRPGTDEAYVSAAVGGAQAPAVLRVRPDGSVVKLDLTTLAATSAPLEKTGTDLTFWHDVPVASYTVTDMQWHGGRLFVAGLANQRFSSTLRILSYPFASQRMASIEMYHTVHNEWETRAPIRAMAFANVNGRDTLLAGICVRRSSPSRSRSSPITHTFEQRRSPSSASPGFRRACSCTTRST